MPYHFYLSLVFFDGSLFELQLKQKQHYTMAAHQKKKFLEKDKSIEGTKS